MKQLSSFFNSQDLFASSPLWLLHISMYICYRNLLLGQNNNFFITLSVGYCMDVLGRSYNIRQGFHLVPWIRIRLLLSEV